MCSSDLVTYATDADIVSQSRSLSGFDKVEINGSPTVYYAQTDSFSVRVRVLRKQDL